MTLHSARPDILASSTDLPVGPADAPPGIRRRRRSRWAVLAVAGALTLSGCGGLSDKGSNAGSGDDSEFVIGLAAPLTGDYADIGQNSQRGAEMAIKEVNAAGGFAGKQGKLEVQDTAGKPATGVNAVARLTEGTQVRFLLGPDLSTVTLAALDTSKKAQIPQLTSSISPAVMDNPGDWLFRARPSDATNAQIMVRYGVDELKLKKIAVLYGLDAYGQGGLPAIEDAVKEFKANVVLKQGVTPGVKDLTAQVTAVKNSGADGILWWGLIPESAVLIKAVKQLDYTGPLFGANALVNESTVRLAGSAANGVIAATTFVAGDPDPKATAFVKKYQDAYHQVPNDHAPLYYDMVNAIAAAANKAGSTDPAKMRDAMREITVDAITGSMKWNAKGEYDTRSAVMVEIADGKPKVLTRTK